MSITKVNSEDAQAVTPHSVAAKAVHWGSVAFILYAFAKQLDEVDELEDFALLQYEMVFASVFLLLLLARFVFMRSTRPTALPPSTPEQMRLMASVAHLGMYAALALIAISGLTIGGLYWVGIKSGIGMDAALIVHEIAVNASYVLVLLHVAAAIYHRRKRDGIWDAMVPVWRETRSATRIDH